MVHPNTVLGCVARFLAPRKRIAACLLLLLFVVFTIIIFTSANARLQREDHMEETLADLQSRLQFLEAQYRGRQEDVISLQAKMFSDRGNSSTNNFAVRESSSSTVTPAVFSLLKDMAGSKAAAGVFTKHIQQLRIPFVYQLLPHLMNDPYSLKPAYHMRGGRQFCDTVVGIPTVKRDKESYLMITLNAPSSEAMDISAVRICEHLGKINDKSDIYLVVYFPYVFTVNGRQNRLAVWSFGCAHLIIGLTPADINGTLIVVMIGETDLQYVLQTARQIEIMFPKHVKSGLIEVISPSAAYYPNFETIPVTLGDSHKRVKWRTKQNLDNIYLMAYAQSKGTFYLMLEDDVIAKKNYIQEIKKFTATTTVSNPNWFFIEYCHVGGIGKLFRSADLIHFITYVQLFYNNMPIDWLLESYLADRTCTIEKAAKKCATAKAEIRPKYKSSLFQHIGLYSSLKGKIQKIKDSQFGAVPTFYPHTSNPPLSAVKTDIRVQQGHGLKAAYEGQTFFWGEKPRKGNYVEFWFKKPVFLSHYTFRSGNIDHIKDKFYDTTVEVLPARLNMSYTTIGVFDEFGLAEGDVAVGSISAIRLHVHKNSSYWVILSEIELKEYEPPVTGR